MARPKEHKPETILKAAVTVFRSEGINVSTARIAKAAGVANGTLFNYFPTKQALIDAVYLAIKSEMAGAIGELSSEDSIRDRMFQVWDRLLRWVRSHSDQHLVANLLDQSGLVSTEAQGKGNELFGAPLALLEEAKAVGVLVDLPLEYLSALIQQQLSQATVSKLSDDEAEVAFAVLWNGITRTDHPTVTQSGRTKRTKKSTNRKRSHG